ncbi:alpha-glycosidase [Anaerocolumna cellulosilytica]|uniref:Alpha-glycosidase n=1 Tax=Anaerocolumna cellulosilytica TaxID=433286 RepID=A0A6S6R6D1_9FIRM|nr:glycoside hydrolase family 13 protein [Anaerocolumna cellulosilytica]MBB5193910.1 glycosidase [Anaerocolumna cellulosilytica]BCJ94875.1 alpha-glycosidase [Anaerocolumna cellulosilytica]
MNKSAILHIPQSQYAFANDEKTMTIRLRSEVSDLSSCTLYYGDRACSKSPVEFYPLPMGVVARDELFDYYEVTFGTPYNRVCYYFKLVKGEEWIYYYANQFSAELPDFVLDGTVIEGRSEYFQYPVILRSEILDVPDWFKNAVVYNIFPDSFASGKGRIDNSGKQITLEGGAVSKSKFGGTIPGITANLDYIRNLGFNCIYLNPVFTAGESHKYDLLDYYHIDPCLGSDEDFKDLVEKVHDRDMTIVIDGVFNHCSWHFFAFDDVVKNGEQSKYKDWFYNLKFPVIRPAGTKDVPTYACFAYEKKMPKLNTANPEVQKYFEDVCRYWIREYKIDGWRLDVANEIDRNFWRNFRRAAKEENPQIVLIGEVWENSESWLRGDAFDSTMNYNFQRNCREFFAMDKLDAFQFSGAISMMLFRYPTNITLGQLNLLDSHDVPRFLSLCRGDIRKWKLAFLFLMLCPGVPSMFYGDEKRISGIKEAEYRRPMPWQNEENEMADFVKSIVSIRKIHTNPQACFEIVHAEKESRMFAFVRRGVKGTVLVCMNAGEKEEYVEIRNVRQVLMEAGSVRDKDNYKILPYGLGIYLLQ